MYILITYEGFEQKPEITFYDTKREADKIINFWKEQGEVPEYYLAQVLSHNNKTRQHPFVSDYLERSKSQAGQWTPMGRRDEFGGL